jgi:putative transposase
MPRQARVIVPGFPHHIVQRGHNRQPVFVERRDFEYYLANLQEWKQVYELDEGKTGTDLFFKEDGESVSRWLVAISLKHPKIDLSGFYRFVY